MQYSQPEDLPMVLVHPITLLLPVLEFLLDTRVRQLVLLVLPAILEPLEHLSTHGSRKWLDWSLNVANP